MQRWRSGRWRHAIMDEESCRKHLEPSAGRCGGEMWWRETFPQKNHVEEHGLPQACGRRGSITFTHVFLSSVSCSLWNTFCGGVSTNHGERRKTNSVGGWWCGACGQPYDWRKPNRLLTWQFKRNLPIKSWKGNGWVMQGVLSRASFRRPPVSGQVTCAVFVSTYQQHLRQEERRRQEAHSHFSCHHDFSTS